MARAIDADQGGHSFQTEPAVDGPVVKASMKGGGRATPNPPQLFLLLPKQGLAPETRRLPVIQLPALVTRSPKKAGRNPLTGRGGFLFGNQQSLRGPLVISVNTHLILYQTGHLAEG